MKCHRASERIPVRCLWHLPSEARRGERILSSPRASRSSRDLAARHPPPALPTLPAAGARWPQLKEPPPPSPHCSAHESSPLPEPISQAAPARSTPPPSPIRQLLSPRLNLTRSKLSMEGDSLTPSQAGATPNRLKRKAPNPSDATTTSSTSAGDDQAAEEEEVEELEREVADLGRRILEHRRNAATRFLDAAVSHITALRPPPCPEVPSEQQSVAGTAHAEAEEEMLEKLKVFKTRTEDCVAAVPKVLAKVNECVAQMEKLEQLNVTIHPVFRRNGSS